MLTKTTIVSLLAITLLALGGIGYAQFTSTATVNVNASAGNIILTFSSVSAVASSPTYNVCSVTPSGNTITVTMSAFAPGDYCTITGTLTNSGNIPATLTESNVCQNGVAHCQFVYADNLAGGYLAAGQAYAGYSATVTLPPTATTQSQTDSIVITVTGTAA